MGDLQPDPYLAYTKTKLRRFQCRSTKAINARDMLGNSRVWKTPVEYIPGCSGSALAPSDGQRTAGTSRKLFDLVESSPMILKLDVARNMLYGCLDVVFCHLTGDRFLGCSGSISNRAHTRSFSCAFGGFRSSV